MDDFLEALPGLVAIGLWVAGFIGWGLNLWKLVAAIGEPVTTLFIARCVGVLFAPLGAVLGFF